MHRLPRLAALLSLAAACTPLDDLPAYQPRAASSVPGYEAVLVAGDGSLKVFDHATGAMRDRLVARAVPAAAIQRLSADGEVIAEDGVRTASLDRVRLSVRGLHPTPGQVCLVYATSHGAPGLGLSLTPFREFLTPAALDDALAAGCGEAPTVVVVSACFSGSFAQAPMARPNRIILTAARADRPSFGCGAEFDYTVFDRCLLEALDHSRLWQGAYGLTQACVTAEETQRKFPPSFPQGFFGAKVADLALPERQ